MVTYVTWDVPFRGNFELRPLGVAMGNRIPRRHAEGNASQAQEASTKYQLYPAKGVAPGTVSGCPWHYPLRPKTRAAYPETYLLKAGTPGPRVELEGLES